MCKLYSIIARQLPWDFGTSRPTSRHDGVPFIGRDREGIAEVRNVTPGKI